MDFDTLIEKGYISREHQSLDLKAWKSVELNDIYIYFVSVSGDVIFSHQFKCHDLSALPNPLFSEAQPSISFVTFPGRQGGNEAHHAASYYLTQKAFSDIQDDVPLRMPKNGRIVVS